MTGFQYIGIIAMILFLLITIGAMSTKRLGRIPSLLWILVWAFGIIALFNPNITTTLANSVGIHRGADLLLYIVVIIMTTGFFSMYLRLRQIRKEFTLLVRKLSIIEADRDGDCEDAR